MVNKVVYIAYRIHDQIWQQNLLTYRVRRNTMYIITIKIQSQENR